MIVLSGDIGGTNTRLILVEINGQEWSILVKKNYPSNNFESLQQVISYFLKECNCQDRLEAACFAVAGPVIAGVSKITNLPWLISEEQLSITLDIPKVTLINDFMAVARGISRLCNEDTLTIQQGELLPNHPNSAVIGAGTGLGACHRVWINDCYHIFPSETGHTGFAPEGSIQTELLAWLQANKNVSHVSLEAILSGSGLVMIYQFLHEKNYCEESNEIRLKMLETDPALVISESALHKKDKLCEKTLEIFTEIYGASAGNVALQYYPVDEVYIAGGIAPKIREKINTSSFLDAFNNKGLMSTNMRKITVKVILNDRVGLYGAISTIEV